MVREEGAEEVRTNDEVVVARRRSDGEKSEALGEVQRTKGGRTEGGGSEADSAGASRERDRASMSELESARWRRRHRKREIASKRGIHYGSVCAGVDEGEVRSVVDDEGDTAGGRWRDVMVGSSCRSNSDRDTSNSSHRGKRSKRSNISIRISRRSRSSSSSSRSSSRVGGDADERH